MADVTLTAALRSNLLSLQGTQALLNQTQLRIATGLKVNSALDNPSSFFAAQSLNNRAGDLSNLLDGMGQAIQTLKAADQGITAITKFLEQAQSIAQQALDSLNAGASTASTASLGASFNSTLTQSDNLAADSGYRGTNLLSGAVSQTVTFSETAAPSTLSITGYDLKTGGDLTVVATGGTFTIAAATTAIAAIKADLATIRADASQLGTNLSIIQTRQDFTQNLINTLKEGADKLVVADKNEEGAKLLALQTTQQLGITSLSLASQANQSILRLFQ